MKQLKINIPEGYKIDNFNTETGEISFKPQLTITQEELFSQIFDGCVVRFGKKRYPDSIFYFDKNEANFLAMWNKNQRIFFVNSNKVWNKFENKFSLDYDSTQDLLYRLVKSHFIGIEISNVIPAVTLQTIFEEHFNSN